MNLKCLVFICALQASSCLFSSSELLNINFAIKDSKQATISALAQLSKEQSILAEEQKQRDTYLHNEVQTTRTEIQAIRTELQETNQTLREALAAMQAHTKLMSEWLQHISKQLESK
jgi:5-bromo-4-chloroindolyl phosphate hydrolysis protein